MDSFGKEFVLRHEFKDVLKLSGTDWDGSTEEKHYGINWRLKVSREEEHLSLYLEAKLQENDGMSIEAEFTANLISKDKSDWKRTCNDTQPKTHENSEWGWKDFIKWESMENDYLVNGGLIVEGHVKIKKITVFEKEVIGRLKFFDETQKKYSDVVLVVNGEKFFVSKLFLSNQSTHFADLFKNFENSEIKLENFDPYEFQKFLEVLHGESAVNEYTVVGILKLADLYGAPTAIRRCEEFLLEKSTKKLKEKLILSTKYKMELLKTKCLDQIKTVDQIRDVTPAEPSEMDNVILLGLLKKMLTLVQT